MNYTGPLTRTSTMETIELEAALRREQYFVVPSYSEAMLLQPHNHNGATNLVSDSDSDFQSFPHSDYDLSPSTNLLPSHPDRQ